MAVQYLDPGILQNFDARAFRSRLPYPWSGLSGILRPEAYARLREELPPLALFHKEFGKERRYGQQSHDRYVLEYEPGLDLPSSWRGFIDELQGPVYRRWLAEAIGSNRFDLHFHWHYTPTGKSVSPHCDASRKLGSHIFYFNTEEDWDPAWGGATVILDDGGRFGRRSAPAFEEFVSAETAESLGNRSLLFVRNGNSWHGVREICGPEDCLRKIFIVVIERATFGMRLRRLLAA
jgi:hypothetical protein